MKNEELEELRMINKLLILSLLRSNTSFEIISRVTGIPPQTLRNRFPVMKDMRRR